MMRFSRSLARLGLAAGCCGLFLPSLPGWAAPATLQPMTPRSDLRRNEVLARLVAGRVEWQRGHGTWQPVVPETLLRAGDGLRTGERGLLVLELPLQAGFVHILANSRLSVQDLQTLPGFDGPLSTTLELNGGKAFVRLRKFNRSRSRFNVRTPSGSAVVRGTEFVVSVDDQQRTTIGVSRGHVQAQTARAVVDLFPGQMTTILPGAVPLPASRVVAVPIHLRRLQPVGGTLQVTGTAAVGSSVLVNGEPAKVDAEGVFSVDVPLAADTDEVAIEALDATGHLETLHVTAGS